MSNAIHLQGIGLHKAIPAVELHVGCNTVWNFGHIAEVLAVEEASPKFVRITARSFESGSVYTRRLKKDRLVAVTTRA